MTWLDQVHRQPQRLLSCVLRRAGLAVSGPSLLESLSAGLGISSPASPWGTPSQEGPRDNGDAASWNHRARQPVQQSKRRNLSSELRVAFL